MAFWLGLIGFALQALGVVVTAIGFRKTWAEFGSGPFPPAEWVRRRIWRPLVASLRRLLRRPRQHVIGVGGIDGQGMADNARGRVTWGPLPGTVPEAIAVLDRRLRDTWDALTEARERMQDDVEGVRKDIKGLGGQLGETARRLEEQARHVAVEGIVWETGGLFLVALGLAFQAVGFVVDGH